jgi:ActR/RegA family two-component response regulator
VKQAEKPCLLCVGHDGMLNRTRRLILQKTFDVILVEDLGDAAAILKQQRCALVLLCYSLTDEECRAMVQLIHGLAPETRILALGPARERLPLGARDGLFQSSGPADLVHQIATMMGTARETVLPASAPRQPGRPAEGEPGES